MTRRTSNSAVVAVNGDLSKKDAMRAEMRKANYASVRGPYKYGNNQFPIQNFYLQDVVKDAEGNSPSRPSPRSSRTVRISSTTSAT